MATVPIHQVPVQAIVIGSSWDTSKLDGWLTEANNLYKNAGIQFAFEPAADTVFEPNDVFAADPSGALATKIALKYRGKLVVFLRDADPKVVGHFSGPGEYAHFNRSHVPNGGKVAHELGHYFLLGHTFVHDRTLAHLAELIRTAVEANPTVKAALSNGQPVPDEPTGQIANEVMNREMNGDDKPGVVFPVADTPSAIHTLPPPYVDACKTGLSFDFDVTFSNGQTRKFKFTPDQANLMGYAHGCFNLPLYFSPQQIQIMRASLAVGSRAHLVRGAAWHPPQDQPGPAADSWGPGHVDLFALFPDGSIRSRAWDKSTSAWWPGASWLNLGGDAIGTPSVVSWDVGHLDLFARFADGTIRSKAWDKSTGAWWPGNTTWLNLGGNVRGSPAVASWGPGHLDLFARFADGSVRSKAWDKSTSAWWPGNSSWFNLGGTTEGSPAVVAWGTGHLDLFARFSDGSVRSKTWDQGTRRWWPDDTSWLNLGGDTIGSPAVVSWGKGHLDLLARFSDGSVRSKTWDEATRQWWPGTTSWFNLGGKGYNPSSPAAVSWGPGRVDVFAVFGDGDVWTKNWDKSIGRWSPGDTEWTPLGGKAFASLSATSWGAGHIDLFARFADGTIRSKVWDNATGKWWPGATDWSDLLKPSQL